MVVKYILKRYYDLKKEYQVEKKATLIGCLINGILYGASPGDYFKYGFFKLKHKEKKNWITYRKHKKIQSICNDTQYTKYFESKELFNQKFNDYIKREWLDVDNCTESDLTSFLKNNEYFFLKDKNGCEGRGIEKIKSTDVSSVRSFISHHSGCIIEELVTNHMELAELAPSSLNTIRITTCRNTNTHEFEIMSCALRIGLDKDVDNISAGGMCVGIDWKTGGAIGKGIDKWGREYSCHPISGKKIEGFVVPCWDEVKKIINELVTVCPEVGYVGWDIAICEDKVLVIEGNNNGNHDIQQLPIKKGLWNEYKRVLSI